jgi:peptidoglycan/LPS O-acetylase OafA/YrhL
MTILSRARAAAVATPTDRLRSIDFVRAASMLVVVFGHWLMALIWLEGETPHFGHALADAPWTQWLTWAVQVMPLFFLAGGFSNARSLGAARSNGTSAWGWVGTRVRRLMTPTVPLVLLWTALVALFGTVDPTIARAASTVALVPLWFLAVYLVVVLLVPLTHRLHTRFGMWAVAAGVAAATVVDLLRFGLGWEWIGWANFGFVWLTIHQVGYSWDQRPTPRIGTAVAGVGMTVLVALVVFGPYPISMVGVPGEATTNTTPPTLALLALATFQAGLLSALTPRLERWLADPRRWTAVVLLGGSIMGLYVWHMTAMVAGALGLFAMGGGILVLTPLSAGWWATRPVWFALLATVVVGMVLATQRFASTSGSPVDNPWRLVTGTLGMCAALAVLLLGGFVNASGEPNLVATGTFVAGALAVGASPFRIPARQPSESPLAGS